MRNGAPCFEGSFARSMATIVLADRTGRYDGRDLERRPLGGTESSVIRLARALVARGHDVTCCSNCDGMVEDHGVRWRPLSGAAPGTCDLYVAVHQTDLLGLVRRPARRALWVIWPARQLRHYKRVLVQWRYRPVPVFASLWDARAYAWWLPPHDPKLVVPLGLPDDIRGLPPLAAPPPARAIFASSPQRQLKRLAEMWLGRIAPRVPGAVLDVYGVTNLPPGADAWSLWSGSLLPDNVPEAQRKTIRVHPSARREELVAAVRNARAMLYLGHKAEAFCLAVAEAQAMGVPCVVAPNTVLPERVIDGLTGFVRGDEKGFVEASVALLADDELWRSHHEAALRTRQGLSWAEVAIRFEDALLSDRVPTDWALGDGSVRERRPPLIGTPNDLS
jgi:glycosyltransferase involved in cell wall biosynthesis